MRVFVNRKQELSELKKLVEGKSKVLIIGLRGYGKTSLVKKLVDEMGEKGKTAIYIDCNRVFSPTDIVMFLIETLKSHSEENDFRIRELELMAGNINAKESLEILFKYSSEAGVKLIVFDEISTLINRFSLLNPYRGFGGAISVGQHLKSLLNSYNIAVFFVDTSINTIFDIFNNYSSPLFKEITHKINLEPLELNDSTKLAEELLKERKIEVEKEVIDKIAQYSGGVPTYIRILTEIAKPNMNKNDFEQEFFRQLREGILNDYFSALFEKFPTTEQEVLILLSRGLRRYNEIASKAINPAKALESLKLKGVIYKIKASRKEVYYGIKDRLFAAWLSQSTFPRLKEYSKNRIKIYYLGYEAIVREIFRTLKEETTIRDQLGRTLKITPPKQVFRYEGALGEIDMICIGEKETLVGEIYAGTKYPKRKIHQLITNMNKAEKMGYKNIKGLAITKEEFSKEAINEAKKIAQDTEIYLLDINTIKKLSKKSEIKL